MDTGELSNPKYLSAFNLSYDDSLSLVTNINGTIQKVPQYGKVNKLLPKDIVEFWDMLLLCVDAKRVVFDSMATGSDFVRIAREMK